MFKRLNKNNYIRKGWSVMARIFQAATPEQESSLNIEELKDAGKLVIEELWKLGLTRIPSVNRYASKLSELLSASFETFGKE